MSTFKDLPQLKLRLARLCAKFSLRPSDLVLSEQAALLLHGSSKKYSKLHIYVTQHDFARIRTYSCSAISPLDKNTCFVEVDNCYLTCITKPLDISVVSGYKCLSLKALSEHIRYKANTVIEPTDKIYYNFLMQELTSLIYK